MIAIFAVLAVLGAAVAHYLPVYPPLRHNGELVANVKGGRNHGPFLDVFHGHRRRYLPPGYYGWPYGLPPNIVSNPFYVERRHRRRHHRDSYSRSRSDSRDRDYDRRDRRRRDSSDSRDW
ncbi:unnamed protein product [Cylicostephanus goldi]|uniref:Secreted protein n=1 Tax=Cylicostephanus goldi TaxID=71465 RepID=A0A3P7M299_CYLGO|nr:unnamed protein product [Cylicostephanus goldi]